MKITVKVIPNSKFEKVEQTAEKNFKVWLKSKPIDNKANDELIKICS